MAEGSCGGGATYCCGACRMFDPRTDILYDLQVVVPGLAVCVCDFSVFVNETEITRSVGQSFFF